MRKTVKGILCIALCLMLCCGCGSTAVNASQLGSADLETLKELDTPYVGMVLKSLDGQFYPLVKAGAEAEASRLGVELIVVAPESENGSDEQAELLSIMSGMALDVLAVSPCDEDTLTDSLELAYKNGKHIIAVDEPLEYEHCEDYIGTDDLETGRREGAFAAREARSDTAIILRGSEKSKSHTLRTQGLKQRLYQSGINVAEVADCGSSRSEAYKKAAELLKRYPNIGVICTTDDNMALGAQQAAAGSGNDVPIVSADGTPDIVKLIKDGKIAGTIDRNAYEIGVKAIDSAVALYGGEKISQEYVPTRAITKNTAQKCLDIFNKRLK